MKSRGVPAVLFRPGVQVQNISDKGVVWSKGVPRELLLPAGEQFHVWSSEQNLPHEGKLTVNNALDFPHFNLNPESELEDEDLPILEGIIESIHLGEFAPTTAGRAFQGKHGNVIVAIQLTAGEVPAGLQSYDVPADDTDATHFISLSEVYNGGFCIFSKTPGVPGAPLSTKAGSPSRGPLRIASSPRAALQGRQAGHQEQGHQQGHQEEGHQQEGHQGAAQNQSRRPVLQTACLRACKPLVAATRTTLRGLLLNLRGSGEPRDWLEREPITWPPGSSNRILPAQRTVSDLLGQLLSVQQEMLVLMKEDQRERKDKAAASDFLANLLLEKEHLGREYFPMIINLEYMKKEYNTVSPLYVAANCYVTLAQLSFIDAAILLTLLDKKAGGKGKIKQAATAGDEYRDIYRKVYAVNKVIIEQLEAKDSLSGLPFTVVDSDYI